MKFTRYENIKSFADDTLEILLENEVQNNLPIAFTKNERGADTSDWMLGSIKDASGGIVLIAACTPPHNIVLYETRNKPNDAAVNLLINELKSMGFTPPGVLAEQGLARRFAQTHSGGKFRTNLSMNIMRLDKVNEIPKAPGHCRPIREDDLFYLPYWDMAFAEECNIEVPDILTSVERKRATLDRNTHYIWEDRHPVSMAGNSRNTENGAVVTAVYTPPHYRGKGYASSTVAKLSQILLERGNKFCCLFADAANPISCGIYRKIGFCDVCVFDELKFDC